MALSGSSSEAEELALRPKGGGSRGSQADTTPPEVGLSGLVAMARLGSILATFPLI